MPDVTGRQKRSLWLQAAKQQLLPTFVVTAAALLCAAFSAGGVLSAYQGNWLALLLALPMAAGSLYLLYFAVSSFLSSSAYYYESALNKKYGRYFNGTITAVERDITEEWRRINGERRLIESHTLIFISTLWQGQELTAEYAPPEGKEYLADQLTEGIVITFRMVPGMPQTLRIAPQKLTRQLESMSSG